MTAIPFVFSGTEDEFRALDPVHYWGRWTASTVGMVLVGVIHTQNPNVRSHTHPQMTFLPGHGSNVLTDKHLAACNGLGVGIKQGHTLSDAVAAIYAVNPAAFLDPDRY